jgi:hypothetical protein
VSKGTAQAILHELGVRKLESRFVPRFSSSEMSEQRLEYSQANLLLFQQHCEVFLSDIITQDETPISLYLRV